VVKNFIDLHMGIIEVHMLTHGWVCRFKLLVYIFYKILVM
jgi:hypothetical protein